MRPAQARHRDAVYNSGPLGPHWASRFVTSSTASLGACRQSACVLGGFNPVHATLSQCCHSDCTVCCSQARVQQHLLGCEGQQLLQRVCLESVQVCSSALNDSPKAQGRGIWYNFNFSPACRPSVSCCRMVVVFNASSAGDASCG